MASALTLGHSYSCYVEDLKQSRKKQGRTQGSTLQPSATICSTCIGGLGGIPSPSTPATSLQLTSPVQESSESEPTQHRPLGPSSAHNRLWIPGFPESEASGRLVTNAESRDSARSELDGKDWRRVKVCFSPRASHMQGVC